MIRATRQRHATISRARVVAYRSISIFGIATTTNFSSPLVLSAKFSQEPGQIHVLSSKPSIHGMSRTFFPLIRSFPQRRSDKGSDITTLMLEVRGCESRFCQLLGVIRLPLKQELIGETRDMFKSLWRTVIQIHIYKAIQARSQTSCKSPCKCQSNDFLFRLSLAAPCYQNGTQNKFPPKS